MRASSRPCSFFAAWYSKFSERSPNERAVAIASTAAARRGPSSSASSASRAARCSGVRISPDAAHPLRLPRALVRNGRPALVLLARAPRARPPSRPRGTRVALGLGVDPRELQAVSERQRLLVHPRPADDEDLLVDRRRERERLRDARGDEHAVVAGAPARGRR